MQREIKEMREQLAGYIEATYHLSHPKTVTIRRALLDRIGGISQEPYIESSASYVGDRKFGSLNIQPSVRDLLSRLASADHGNLLFDPPYQHQADALELSQAPASGGTGIVITTGTGSGKTEAFLLPVMARLAEEASARPDHFQDRAVRALLLYPMNALVNDQLGRLRNLFGDESVRSWFEKAAGRPAKFGRYTGRSLYPGRRDGKRDQDRLKSLSYYLDLEDGANAGDVQKAELVDTLKRKGRWPSKADSVLGANDGLRAWYGGKNQRWEDSDGKALRAVERGADAELLTRHEMQKDCPDLLVTNYSMLEYMLLRPIERSIFDKTRDYFQAHPDEKFLFVLDEAHLYRGANGTEVAFLIRRFLDRLNLPLSRIVFICTSASFSRGEAAKTFASQLTGLDASAFTVLTGRKEVIAAAAQGNSDCVAALAACDLTHLASLDADVRASVLAPLLAWRPSQRAEPVFLTRTSGEAGLVTIRGLGADGSESISTLLVDRGQKAVTEHSFVVVTDVRPLSGTIAVARSDGLQLGTAVPVGITWNADDLARAAWMALQNLEVVGLLKNVTSGAIEISGGPLIGAAKSLSELSDLLFAEGDVDQRIRATDVLLELASLARPSPGKTPLLPARVHLMFRGLPGLWACLDPNCSQLDPDLRGGPTGSLYAQPRRHCDCGAQVLELHSCRSCGLAVAKAFAGAPLGQQHLWADDGANYGGENGAVTPVHVCLEPPAAGGLLSTAAAAFLDVVTGRLNGEGVRVREIWHQAPSPGVFERCPRCDGDGEQISDLQTKGEEPFQQLVAVQVLEQPPRPESTAPLKGRKALVFSDGRQTASRLAGVMKTFAFRDSLRPLLVNGMSLLESSIYKPSLDDAPIALALSAHHYDVRLRPVDDDGTWARRGIEAQKALADPDVTVEDIRDLSNDTSGSTPRSVFENLYAVIQDRHTGLNALALGSIKAKLRKIDLTHLQVITPPSLADVDVDVARDAVVDLWLWASLQARAVRLTGTPGDVEGGRGATAIAKWNGKFDKSVRKALTEAGHGIWITQFEAKALPILREVFALQNEPTFQLSARKVRLEPGLITSWRRCETCTAVSPSNVILGGFCPACGGRSREVDPEMDPVFRSRKSFFRRSSERLASEETGFAPHQLIAEEHSAQLNDSNAVRAMSRNEAYELRFQDVPVSQDGQPTDPIDVLSCTTTMEVGIDIGGLTAVALRNVPPGRANYQQRAGRAGRRGAGLSTVLMFCGADSHDQSFFANPAPIVAGPAPDPVLNLDNPVIAERQAFAFLLGRFQQARIVGGTNANIFDSLGLTSDFLSGPSDGFSLAGLKAWLTENGDILTVELNRLFVASCPGIDAPSILARWPRLLEEKLGTLQPEPTTVDTTPPAESEDEVEDDASDNDNTGAGSTKLLDRLFATGLMPRYAFPTDVATFAVFADDADAYRPALLYSPQQALNAALAQYAPGHEVWIDSKRHLSLGIWSSFEEERLQAYRAHKLYFHCQICDYALLVERDAGMVGQTRDCPACRASAGMGPAQRWVRPVGFAHPPSVLATPPRIEGTTNSRPTRAKLDAPHFSPTLRVGGTTWPLGAGWEAWRDNRDLVVTNRGTQTSRDQGFRYCTQCGRTEPTDLDQKLRQLKGGGGDHERPRPRRLREPDRCSGAVSEIVIGNQFKTDIAIFRMQAPSDWNLDPSRAATVIAAKSAVEALVRAASLDLEPGDIDGDYRFAPGANAATLLDLYIYDQAAGGAGFVKAAAADPVALATKALAILDDCTCEDSCYQCLRSYKNRFDHGDLDRRLGADLLRACFFGISPTVPETWANAALLRLCEDMNDSGAAFTVEDGGLLSSEGQSVILAHPFTPDAPGNAAAAKFAARTRSSRAVDVLLVDRALPLATARALNQSSKAGNILQSDVNGVPFMTITEVLAGADPASVQKVSIGAFEPGDFVMRLEARTLDGPYGDGSGPVPRGTPCLFRPFEGLPDPKQIYLLRRTDGHSFQATQSGWTVGRLQLSANSVRVRYSAASDRLECVSEVVIPAETVVPIAVFVRSVS